MLSANNNFFNFNCAIQYCRMKKRSQRVITGIFKKKRFKKNCFSLSCIKRFSQSFLSCNHLKCLRRTRKLFFFLLLLYQKELGKEGVIHLMEETPFTIPSLTSPHTKPPPHPHLKSLVLVPQPQRKKTSPMEAPPSPTE